MSTELLPFFLYHNATRLGTLSLAELDAIGKWQMKMQTKELGISPSGEAELYHIGQRLRKKVPGLLHSHFDPHEIEMRCTDTDRSKRSALSFLQGIYEHSGEKTYMIKVKIM